MAYEDHAERSIRAGLQALAAVEAFQSPDGERLKARIGIRHLGTWSSATLLAAARTNAARSQGTLLISQLACKALPRRGQIVVADSTRRLAGQSFEIESLGAQELKGFKSRIALFAVRGEREVESRFDAAHASALSTICRPNQRNRHAARSLGTGKAAAMAKRSSCRGRRDREIAPRRCA